MARLKITYKKSVIGYREDQKRTISALGFRKLNQTIEHEDTAPIRGMVNKVAHLLEIEELA